MGFFITSTDKDSDEEVGEKRKEDQELWEATEEVGEKREEDQELWEATALSSSISCLSNNESSVEFRATVFNSFEDEPKNKEEVEAEILEVENRTLPSSASITSNSRGRSIWKYSSLLGPVNRINPF